MLYDMGDLYYNYFTATKRYAAVAMKKQTKERNDDVSSDNDISDEKYVGPVSEKPSEVSSLFTGGRQ